jgi:putative membrane protein
MKLNFSAMLNLLIRLVLTAIAIIIAGFLLKSGVQISDYLAAVFVAAFLAILNSTIRPILVILTIPITLFTFGLFLLVINALMVMIAAYFIDGFHVENFWWALAFSLILSLINGVFSELADKKN